MKKIWNLARILRMAGGGSGEGTDKGGLNESILLMALFTIGGCALMGWVGTVLPTMNSLMQDEQFGYNALLLFIAAGAVISIVLLIPTIVNTFYMSTDLPVILVMPYTPMQIVMARVINLCPIALLAGLISSLPAGIAYSFYVSVTPSFYFALILAFIAVSFISLCFICTVLMILMNFVRILRNNDHLRVIGILAAFALYIGYVFVTGSRGDGDKMTFAAELLNSLSKFSYIFPVNFALKSLMTEFSVISILEVAGITAAFAAVFYFTAKNCYLAGALAMQSTSSGGHALDEAGIRKMSGRKGFAESIAVNDFRQIKRNPNYLMQGFLVPFGMPLIMLFVMGSSYAQNHEEMGELIELLKSSFSIQLLIAVVVPVYLTLVSASTNAILNAPVSREGESFLLLKQFPINWKDYIKGKQLLSLRVGLASTTLYTVLTMLLLLCTGIINILGAACMLIMNLAVLVAVIDNALLHDLKKPSLNWENEAGMLKKAGRPYSIILLLAGIAAIVGAVVVLVLAPQIVTVLAVAVLVMSVVLAFVLNMRLYKVGPERLENL